ncbi:CPBP family intramembrane metalloprotease [Rubrobacter taiwanensis]|jgi:membrane protease YdiL (CAAX protease family)|uniref:CPBP family intramembrane metalloprotease n=1 Tax=Rubrobacter taiwanensis TaxID=185139 RepID=A0A4R1BJD8_9ACTN|nr:CPBP family intramembrane glutamic endopeptidase [Rubrobacter taiwanensis]TCJ17347.1 CPBP family intramembrane metalloprotease [Rubrobacter taiwanensis]
MGAGATIFLTTLVVILALIAHQGKRSRRAQASLAMILLFLSLMVAGVGVLLFFTLRLEGGAGISTAAAGAMAAILALAGLAGMALCLWPLRRLTGRRVKRAKLAEPTIFLGVWLFIMVLANNLIGFIAFMAVPDVTELLPGGGDLLSPAEILTTALPLVVVALFGVGFLIRRNVRQTARRLGYGGISAPELGIVGLFVLGSLGLAFAADAAFEYLQPELYREVGDISEGLFVPAGRPPLEAALFALLIGISAGFSEETLFRGAVQPALGIFATSVLFTSMHIQYGPSVVLIQIFIWSLAVGILRRKINTTAAFLAHAAYNFLVVMLAYAGFGI